MIRNVLFDLDDTLLDFEQAERVALTKTLTHFGIDPCEDTLARYHVINRDQWKRLERGEITRDEVKVGRYRLLFEELRVDCSPQDATRCYETQLGIGHYFVDGAEALLQRLHGCYRLYLVTNGTAHVQKSRIASAGLARYMDGIFISQEIGFDKPSTGFFDRAFAMIEGFDRHQTVIVGDSLTSDIQGGRNAGIATVWFNPHGEPNTTPILPDHEIRRLDELDAVLEQM